MKEFWKAATKTMDALTELLLSLRSMIDEERFKT